MCRINVWPLVHTSSNSIWVYHISAGQRKKNAEGVYYVDQICQNIKNKDLCLNGAKSSECMSVGWGVACHVVFV